MTDDFAKGWLQGAFDSDGGVTSRKQPSYRNKDIIWNRGYIQFSNTDGSIIKQAEKCLNHLKIHHQKPRWYDRTKHKGGKPHWKPVCHLLIESTEGVNGFLSKVGFSCGYKQKRLREIASYKNRPNAPKRIKAPNKEFLQELYWKRKLDMTQIAKELGYASGVSILKLMRKYGIPVRSKSERTKLIWQRRRHNN